MEIDSEGRILYTVVEGDVGGLICDRFGRMWWQLERANGDNDGFDCYTVIDIGEVVVPTNNPDDPTT
ncbi:hypothetical protein [Okibacterium endophyticum]